MMAQSHASQQIQPMKRFDFSMLQNFASADDEVLDASEPEAEAPPPPPPPPVFSEAELEKAKKDAHAQGVKEGIAQGTDQQQQAVQQASEAQTKQIATLGEQLSQVHEAMQQQIDAQHHELLQLAAGVARKLAQDALIVNYEAVLKAMLHDTLPDLLAMPSLCLKTHHDTLDSLESLMNKMVKEYGFEGAYQCLAADGMQPGDIRIEWEFGASERSLEALIAGLEDVLPVSIPEVDMSDKVVPHKPRLSSPSPAALHEEETEEPETSEEPAQSNALQQRMQALVSRKTTS